MSAYHFSGEDRLYLDKAIELADRMLPAFNTTSGLPLSSVNLAQRVGIPDRHNNGWVSTAEVATLQLEFRYLSALTDEDIYWRTVENVHLFFEFQVLLVLILWDISKVMFVIKRNNVMPRLVTIFME